MKQSKNILTIILFIVFFISFLWSGTTGKLSGAVSDISSGNTLSGVVINVEGTSLSAESDSGGRYAILSLTPGEYKVQFSLVGYKTSTVNIQVFADRTVWLDIALEADAIEPEQLSSPANLTHTVKQGTSTNIVSFSSHEIEDLPVTSVVSVIGLNAGIHGGWNSILGKGGNLALSNGYSRGKVSVESDLNIRGGEADNILFSVDGVMMRDPRNSEPLMGIPISAIREVYVEPSGFNAEYGQARSGVINVITKEGNKQSYSGSFQVRYSPPARKYGSSPGVYDIQDPNSFVLRPFFDPAVCWTGTNNGNWDYYTRRQYPEFAGWNEISNILMNDNNPSNDLTPAGAQRVFTYEARKKLCYNEPDYDIDGGFGGPVPFISQSLGDLRFFTSYRSTREMLLVALSRPDYKDYDWTMQLTSDITPSMKLQFSSIAGKQYTLRGNFDEMGSYSYIRNPEDIANAVGNVESTSDLYPLFSDSYFALSDIGHRLLAAKFIHTINSQTFYEVSVSQISREYNTRPTSLRDTSQHYQVIPGYFADPAPLGYWPAVSNTIVIKQGSTGSSRVRDYTSANSTTVKADFSSQLSFYHLLKAGVEFSRNDLKLNYGTVASLTMGTAYESRTLINGTPTVAAFYVQDKFELKNFIINAGLRLDYNDSKIEGFNNESIWYLSPRFNIAWAILEGSTVYFNYGHFKQMVQLENLYFIRRDISNPNLIPPRTISYELGFEQMLPEDFSFHAAVYYNDIKNQQGYIFYETFLGINDLKTWDGYANNYGLELTLRKNIGEWISGLINYTYQRNIFVYSDYTGYDPYQQRLFDESEYAQNDTITQPFAKANINIHTPENFGPSFGGHNILGGIGLSTVMDWQAGYWTTWNPFGVPSVSYNVQSVDYFNVALRLDKVINFGGFRIQLFMDIDNVLNTRRLWIPETNLYDNLYYMESLHLPKSDAYPNIVGNDKIGDYRKPGVEFQPMEHVVSLDFSQAGYARAWYFEDRSGKYFEYKNNQWSEVDSQRLNKVLDDKAYIDMPNASTFWFLNPRRFFFGIKCSFNFGE